MSEITELLRSLERGDKHAVDRLFPLVYNELRALAAHQLRGERRGHTLQTTALVHEAYLRLVGNTHPGWQSRAHFLSIASRAIRQVLVDHARGRDRQKRGGGLERVTLSESLPGEGERGVDLLALDLALTRLSDEDPEALRLVELRFFGGLTVEEIAAVLGVTDRTVRRRWNFAQAWLYRELGAAG